MTDVQIFVPFPSPFSWEYGTASEAFLELDYPDISCYGPNPFPPPYVLNETAWPISNAE